MIGMMKKAACAAILFALCLIAGAIPAFAADGEVIVYEHVNAEGASAAFSGDVKFGSGSKFLWDVEADDFARLWERGEEKKWGGIISSVRVPEGCYAILYEGFDFSGEYAVLGAGFHNLTDYSMNDVVSSMSVRAGITVILYEHNNREGRAWGVIENIPQFPKSNKGLPRNDAVSSVFVPAHTAIRLYPDRDYSGKGSIRLEGGDSGQFHDISGKPWNFNDRASSLEFI
jgi:hypothetical protein